MKRKFYLRKFYVCANTFTWNVDDCLKFAYPIGKGGTFSLEKAVEAYENESRERDGDGWFDLRVCSSIDNGKTFNKVVDIETAKRNKFYSDKFYSIK